MTVHERKDKAKQRKEFILFEFLDPSQGHVPYCKRSCDKNTRSLIEWFSLIHLSKRRQKESNESSLEQKMGVHQKCVLVACGVHVFVDVGKAHARSFIKRCGCVRLCGIVVIFLVAMIVIVVLVVVMISITHKAYSHNLNNYANVVDFVCIRILEKGTNFREGHVIDKLGSPPARLLY
uniref:Uncharacterized protein n=1 Tax=Glossina pallidipes TaxID=7398 RepID=A0A1A9ZB26_GLOPL